MTQIMNKTKTVFARNYDNDNDNVVNQEDVTKLIPKVNYDKPQEKMIKTHTEWRWRFLKIDGDNYTEISKKNEDSPRLYVDSSGQWMEKSIPNKYDKYVEHIVFAYLKK
jgi:hypothetical protein